MKHFPLELECESLLGTWNDNGHKLQSQSSFNSNQLIAHFRCFIDQYLMIEVIYPICISMPI